MENNQKREALQELRIEYAVKQKKGLPFVMAGIVLWAVMLVTFLTDLDLSAKNIISACCSALLVPVSLLFGKLLKVNTFSKENPLSSPSTLAALNQVMYLPIVVWAMYAVPDKMIMTYAIICGAHFLPYSWLYFSPTYFYAPIVIPIASLLLGIYCNQAMVCLAFVIFDILMCVFLCLENKQAKKYYEDLHKKS